MAIIDVPERVVTVRSGLSSSEDVKQGRAISKNIPLQGLKQGALSKGLLDPMDTAMQGDVFVSQFSLTERQRGLKHALANRSDSGHPKKKVVQPRVIPLNRPSDLDTDAELTRSRPADHAVTAAVAASAAVAATQPFLKAQQELEQRMEHFLKQLEGIQANKLGTPAFTQPGTDHKVEQLERQVAELTERRMEHLENLQQQQMHMQAQLLYMSRSRGHPKQTSRIPQPVMTTNNNKINHPQQPSMLGYTNSTVRNTTPTRNVLALSGSSRPSAYFNTNKVSGSGTANTWSSQTGQSMFNPETMSSHFNYLNEVRELQGSHLDTPAPRAKVPQPMPYSLPQPNGNTQNSLGFLEELLAQNSDPVDGDVTFSVRGDHSPPTKLRDDRNNSALGRKSDKSPVDTARQLVSSLSQLEQETADSVWNPKKDGALSKMSKRDLSPSPFERYLKSYESDALATYEAPVPTSAAKRRARKHQAHLDHLNEAREVLKQLEMTRETLEGNLDTVLRSRRDVEVFTALGLAAPQGSSDQIRIQKLVNKKISSLEADIQREVIRGLAQEKAQRLADQREEERQRLAAKRFGPSGVTSAPPPSTYLAKTKPALSTKQSEQSARLAYGRLNVNTNAGSTLAFKKGKENRNSKVKPPPKPTVIRDEKTMTRTYGKPEYQRGRTTIRDPYMHFQNSKKGVPSKTSLSNESMVEAEVSRRSRSPPKSRQGQGHQPARQFYFSPTRGYIPLSAGDSAPIQGQLVPMAIPLGQPRMERGVRASAVPMATTPKQVTSTPVPAVTAARNVAVVSFPVPDEGRRRERSRSREGSPVRGRQTRDAELSTQVLPPIDIDSISPSSSRRSEIQIRSPQRDNANVTFLQQEDDYEDDFENNVDESAVSDHDLTDPDLEQAGQGLTLPGYEPRTQQHESGPAFPPTGAATGGGVRMSGSSQVPLQQLSDVIAEDLRRRDELERNAVYWLEQELMAQVVSKVMPLEVAATLDPKTADLGKVDAAGSEVDRSEVSERQDDSELVADMIGQGGLQLFIDAGQPVDNTLVQALVREVLQEKVSTMLAQGSAEGQRLGQVKDVIEEEIEENKAPTGPVRVSTPEPTPKTSPRVSPHQQQTTQGKQPITPPLSPPADGFKIKPATQQKTDAELTEQPPPLPPRLYQQREVDDVTGVQTQQQQQQQQEVADLQQQIQQLQQQLLQQQQQHEIKAVSAVEEESEPSVSLDISEELRRVAGQGKTSQAEESVVSHHSVATPPLSPPSIEEEVSAPKRHVTPPPTPAPAMTPPSTARARTPSPKRNVREEMEEDEEDEQPEPIMISVAVGEDHPLSSGVQTAPRRSPSPKRPHTPVSVATEPSPPPSTDSSVSETVNDCLSEGQWLLSRSEGQVVAGLHLNEAVRLQMLKRGGQPRGVNLSTASTLHDTEDLDLDEADPGTRSEGEFLYAGLPAPDQDPMLQLLAEMQRNPGMMVPQRDIPGAQVRQILSGPAPQDMAATGRSVGELSVGQVPAARLVQVKAKQDTVKGPSGKRRSPSPSHSLDRTMNGSLDRSQGSERSKRSSRSPSPQQQRHKEEPSSPQNMRASSLNSSPTRGRPMRGQMQYQPVLSEGAPLSTRGRMSGSLRGRRSSDSRISRSSDRGMQRSAASYVTESVSRSAESLSLRRSGEGAGVLTSSFKSRQSSTGGAKKSVDFDLTGTHEYHEERAGRDARCSPTRLSSSSNGSRPRSVGGSLGLTYSFEESLDDSELKRIVGSTGGTGSGPYRMSVTIPSTAGDGDSDLSEIEISKGN